MAIEYESDVADKPFVEDFVRNGAIVNRALGLADKTSPRGGSIRFRHGEEAPANAKDG
jgi:hypothetical protein